MNIKCFTTEKIDKSFIKKGIKEYDKRLSRYCKIKHIPLKKVEEINQYRKEKTTLVLVNRKGKMISSEGLSCYFNNLGLKGKSEVLLLITEKELPDIQVDMHLALTPMEMDGQLMTLTLYEQVYRAFAILHNLPYHK